MTHLHNCPIEVLYSILEFLNKGDLCRCVRTCKVFNAIGIPLLYRQLHYSNQSIECQRQLSDQLSRRPDLNGHIREIYINIFRHDEQPYPFTNFVDQIQKILKKAKNLCYVYYAENHDYCFSSSPTIQDKLEVLDAVFRSPVPRIELFLDLLVRDRKFETSVTHGEMSRLCSLTLTAVSKSGQDKLVKAFPLYSLRKFGGLRSLSIRRPWDSSRDTELDDEIDWASVCPGLKKLSLGTVIFGPLPPVESLELNDGCGRLSPNAWNTICNLTSLTSLILDSDIEGEFNIDGEFKSRNLRHIGVCTSTGPSALKILRPIIIACECLRTCSLEIEDTAQADLLVDILSAKELSSVIIKALGGDYSFEDILRAARHAQRLEAMTIPFPDQTERLQGPGLERFCPKLTKLVLKPRSSIRDDSKKRKWDKFDEGFKMDEFIHPSYPCLRFSTVFWNGSLYIFPGLFFEHQYLFFHQ